MLKSVFLIYNIFSVAISHLNLEADRSANNTPSAETSFYLLSKKIERSGKEADHSVNNSPSAEKWKSRKEADSSANNTPSAENSFYLLSKKTGRSGRGFNSGGDLPDWLDSM